MTRKELFENERFKHYDCLLIIGSTDPDEINDDVNMAFVLYKDLPIFVQDGVTEVAEFDVDFRKGAKVFSFDIGSPIPDTRDCWSKQEIMDAYKYSSLYCLGTLDNTQENTECVVKVEKTLNDFSYEELATHLCEINNLDFLFNGMDKIQLRDMFNSLCTYLHNNDYDIFYGMYVPKETAQVCNEVVTNYLG